jgi:hypothetical protein
VRTRRARRSSSPSRSAAARVPEARTILAFMTRDAAREVEKVLHVRRGQRRGEPRSRRATSSTSPPTVAPGRPSSAGARARGPRRRIKKRTCHITIALPPETRRPAPLPSRPGPSGPEPSRARGGAARSRSAEAKRARREGPPRARDGRGAERKRGSRRRSGDARSGGRQPSQAAPRKKAERRRAADAGLPRRRREDS